MLDEQYTKKEEREGGELLWVEKKNSFIWETLNLSTCKHHSSQTKQLTWQKEMSPVECFLSYDSYYLGGLGKN